MGEWDLGQGLSSGIWAGAKNFLIGYTADSIMHRQSKEKNIQDIAWHTDINQEGGSAENKNTCR